MKLSGLGQACSAALSPENCSSAGGVYDGDSEECVCSGVAPVTTPVTTPTPSLTNASCATNPCTWWDDVYASQGCLNWYAQCNPTSPFYIANTQGALAALGGAAGSAIGSTAGGLFAGLAASTGIPTVVWYAGLGLLAYALIKK